MMIDFALAAERNEGMNARDAIYQACLLRFRPIMMTTCARCWWAADGPHGAREPSCASLWNFYRRRPPGQPDVDFVHYP